MSAISSAPRGLSLLCAMWRTWRVVSCAIAAACSGVMYGDGAKNTRNFLYAASAVRSFGVISSCVKMSAVGVMMTCLQSFFTASSAARSVVMVPQIVP